MAISLQKNARMPHIHRMYVQLGGKYFTNLLRSMVKDSKFRVEVHRVKSTMLGNTVI